jgi:hypothetical protein
MFDYKLQPMQPTQFQRNVSASPPDELSVRLLLVLVALLIKLHIGTPEYFWLLVWLLAICLAICSP